MSLSVKCVTRVSTSIVSIMMALGYLIDMARPSGPMEF